ncbi:MAG: PAS domain-containing protein, partial [Desulfobacteraceae bacterium]|nr:PAS domain-containing protein [Desulfobacteraceae bacterium]
VFNSIQDGISVLDPELTVVTTNKAMQQLYKHALPFEGKKCFEIYHGQTKRCDPCPVIKCFQTKKLEMSHVPLRRPGLSDGTLELYAFPMVNEKGIPTGVVEYTRDISQRIEDEKAKETLLREIHHRIKNNMQVISSLLSLQASKLSDSKTAKAFAEAENRVHSMSLVHEILYQSDTIDKIDFQAYLKNLISHIANMFALQNIKLDIAARDITLSMEQAVPCGLIVTELITNAMKYAFPDAGSDVIKIQACYLKKDYIEMKISDNGAGFPEGFDLQKSRTLGLHLVRELVHSQLEGNLTLKKGNGVCWVIHWQTT